MDTDGHECFDAFGTLGLARKLAVESDAVENAWRELSRELHPDADTGDAEKAAAINRAKDLLIRPSTRLRHWLELQGVEIPRDAPIDGDLMNLFAEVGATLQETDAFLKEKAAASTALGKALLAEREVAVQQDLQSRMADLNSRKAAVTDRFPEFETSTSPIDAIAATGTLGFLEKWDRQLQERLITLISGG